RPTTMSPEGTVENSIVPSGLKFFTIRTGIKMPGYSQLFLRNKLEFVLPQRAATGRRWFVQRSLVMTVIGEDRPGLVESVAGLVAEHGGNWLESRMSHLGGQFAGIVRVEVPAGREQALVAALQRLDARGLTTVIRSDAPQTPTTPQSLSILEIIGQDRPGIVREISRAL